MKKKTKQNYQDFSTTFMDGDAFKKLVIENKLIDFPFEKADNKFDYIKEVIKYKTSIDKLAFVFYLISLGILSFLTGVFIWSWWNLLISLIITVLPFGIIYKYVNLAAQHQSLIEKAKPFVESAYQDYLKE
jgi:hypothetical protein